jgi:hypothetical protein
MESRDEVFFDPNILSKEFNLMNLSEQEELI